MATKAPSEIQILGNPTKAVVDVQRVRGSWISVADHTSRDSFDPDVRAAGMVVQTRNDGIFWKLQNDLTTWLPDPGFIPPVATLPANNILAVTPTGPAWVDPTGLGLGVTGARGPTGPTGTIGPVGPPGTPGSSAYSANVLTAPVVVGDVGISANVDGTTSITKITPSLAQVNGRGRVGVVTVAATVGNPATLQTTGLIPTSVTGLGTASSASDVIVNVSTGRCVRTAAYTPGIDIFMGVVNPQGVLNLDAYPLSTTPIHVFDCVSHGSDPTGVTNAGPSITATHVAAAAVPGAVTFLKNGTYALNTSIFVTQVNPTFRGESREHTILKNTASITAFDFTSGGNEIGTLTIENMTIDLQGSAGFGGYALLMLTGGHRVSRLVFRNVLIKDPGFHGVGLYMQGITDSIIDHVDMIGTGAGTVNGALVGTFINMTDCHNTTVSYCSGRLIDTGIGAVGHNVNTRIFAWDWDGMGYASPAFRRSNGVGVTYTSIGLTDPSIANWSSIVCPQGTVLRALEERVGTGKTITNSDGSQRYSLIDSTTDFRSFGILEQELIRSPHPNIGAPLFEANVIKDGLQNGRIYHDGWRDATTGLPSDGPASGATYIVHKVTCATISTTGVSGSTLTPGWWYHMDGSRSTPPNGTRYEIGAQSTYGCHVAPDGATGSTSEWFMFGCTAKRTFGDGYSIWAGPYMVVNCYAEWSTDTCMTFNAARGGTAMGNHIRMSGVEGMYIGSIDATTAPHCIVDNTVVGWGWAGKLPEIQTAGAAYQVFGLDSMFARNRAFGENMPNALVAFNVACPTSQVLDNRSYRMASGTIDMFVSGGTPTSLAQTFIRHHGTVTNRIQGLIPSGAYAGSPIYDLTTTILPNGVIPSQPGSKVQCLTDGNQYLKITGVDKSGYKISLLTDPPDWSPIIMYGANAVSWLRAGDNTKVLDGAGNPLTANGNAQTLIDQGFNQAAIANAVAKDSAHRMAYVAQNPTYNNRGSLTMASNTFLDSGIWPSLTVTGSQTWFIVGRTVNNVNYKYFVSGFHDGNCETFFVSGGQDANVGNPADRSSIAALTETPFIMAIVFDAGLGQIRWYENDATIPTRIDLIAPGSHVANRSTVAAFADIADGAQYYGIGDWCERALINRVATPDEIYKSIVGLSLYYGISIVS